MHQYSGILKINLSALRRNWRFLRSQFTGSDCGAVVKANAYGLGVGPVVRTLFSEGCRTFFVATFDEALEVKSLVSAGVEIYVLQGCYPGMERRFVEDDIRPVIVSAGMLERWLNASVVGSRRSALKVNSGMNRLGLGVAEFQSLLARRDDPLSRAGVGMIMSHLACADEPAHPLNAAQLARFQQVVVEAKKYHPHLRASLANSAGIFLGEPWHFDLARPGIALYGGCCLPELHHRLSPVVNIHLPVIQTRVLQSGESIGYGADFVAPHVMKIAVVSGGYADGIFRSFAGNLRGWYGCDLPAVGRISMDSCVFDVTHLPEDRQPKEGDFVEIVGEHQSLDAQADHAGTISYELLTSLGERLQRVYFEDSESTLAESCSP